LKKRKVLTILLGTLCILAFGMSITTYKGIGNKLVESSIYEEQAKSKMSDNNKDKINDDSSGVSKTESETTIVVIETESETESETPVDPECPVLTLKSKKVRIQKGDKFDVIYQVKSITDNKDEKSTLFQDIRVYGDYNLDKEGEYELTYIACDSDGNLSLPQTLKLIVKN